MLSSQKGLQAVFRVLLCSGSTLLHTSFVSFHAKKFGSMWYLEHDVKGSDSTASLLAQSLAVICLQSCRPIEAISLLPVATIL